MPIQRLCVCLPLRTPESATIGVIGATTANMGTTTADMGATITQQVFLLPFTLTNDLVKRLCWLFAGRLCNPKWHQFNIRLTRSGEPL